ncbi:helix-turn-helix domain-containing protein [Clostridium felsineum]|uniref:IS3 family transposase ISSth1b n=1 Tax=Clostridium felsineum TaxID=36839 RepID=A0A1S8L7R2_9CLOT|nr:helix-turn-helix domain-containing protein [Clostridium felsineum]URZ08018.1 IS3 family transposase ISSth1b [Clostridium felsineum]URZ13049.1 IS3 family transposase ISSth1b [Clostridium felsineum]
MKRKGKVSVNDKIRAIKDYLSGKKSVSQICSELQIHKSAFDEWKRKYKLKGEQSLETIKRNTYYPKAIKLQAILDYQEGLGSLNEICSKYDISFNSILRKWIKRYNSHKTFNSHNSQGDKHMINGRKTTYEERIKIVSFYIENNDDYQLTADKYQVSYQQVYSWVGKYKQGGTEALVDRRGKGKPLNKLTET